MHPARKDYGNDARDTIESQPAIQQMIADYNDRIGQLEAQIDDLKIERSELKRSQALQASRYGELVSLIHNGVAAAMPDRVPNPWHLTTTEAIALVARLWVAARNYSAGNPVEVAPEPEAEPVSVPVSVYGPDSEQRPLFSGRRLSYAKWAFWSRVIPDEGYVDLPPIYRIENRS